FAAGTEARLVLAPKDSAKDGVWLAYTDVAVAGPAAVEFLASSRGSLEVWLNGKAIHRREQGRNFQIDSDRFAGHLIQGANRRLVRVGRCPLSQPSPPGGEGRGRGDGVEFPLRFRRKSAVADHERLTQAALARAGNPERGRKLFFDVERSQCLK